MSTVAVSAPARRVQDIHFAISMLVIFIFFIIFQDRTSSNRVRIFSVYYFYYYYYFYHYYYYYYYCFLYLKRIAASVVIFSHLSATFCNFFHILLSSLLVGCLGSHHALRSHYLSHTFTVLFSTFIIHLTI